MNSFVALDVETANPNYASICAIGAARFEEGLVAEQWYQLIDPHDDFFWRNVEIHGIRERDIAGQPTFEDVSSQLISFVDNDPVVHHGQFDRNAIAQATDVWAAPPLASDFIDSLEMARQAWPHAKESGYSLQSLCDLLGYELEHHHHALDDARAAGLVYLAAAERLGEETVPAFARRIVNAESGMQLGLFQDEYRVLVGDVVVFSSETRLLSIEPSLEKELQRQGCQVHKRLGKRSTILVLGDDEWRRKQHSSQRRSAEQRTSEGQRLEVMSETDFMAMIEQR